MIFDVNEIRVALDMARDEMIDSFEYEEEDFAKKAALVNRLEMELEVARAKVFDTAPDMAVIYGFEG